MRLLALDALQLHEGVVDIDTGLIAEAVQGLENGLGVFRRRTPARGSSGRGSCAGDGRVGFSLLARLLDRAGGFLRVGVEAVDERTDARWRARAAASR
jgi:hypothetical protein